jgi:hypothetical protein
VQAAQAVIEPIDQGPGVVARAEAAVALRDVLARAEAAGGVAAVALVGAQSRCAWCRPRARRCGGREPPARNAAAEGWRPSRPRRPPQSEAAEKGAGVHADAAAGVARRGAVAGARRGSAAAARRVAVARSGAEVSGRPLR